MRPSTSSARDGRSKRRFPRRAHALLACIAAAGIPDLVHAEPPPAAQPAQAALALDVEPGVAGLDAAKIQKSVERELGTTMVTATPDSGTVLSIRARGEHRVLMTFRQANGRRVEREVDLPAEPDRALETLGLLAANLVRNEADELIATMLAKAPGTPAPPPVQKPAPAPPPPANVEPSPCQQHDGYHLVTLGADFAPYVGTSNFERTPSVRRLSLQFVGGRSDGLHGLGFSPLLHLTSKFVCGVQVSGLVNAVGGPVEGAQVGGVVNIANGDVDGAQVGVVNYARGVRGAQVSVVSVAAGKVAGVQVGTVAISRGAQGAQIGVVNVASGPVDGVQIGVVNYAEESDLSIGLVSVVRNGRLGIDAFGSETGFLTAAVKHGGKHWHNFYGVTRRTATQEVSWGGVLGLGLHAPLNRFLYVDFDALGYFLTDKTNSPNKIGWLTQGRAVLGVRPIPAVALYAGPTYNAYITNYVDAEPLFRSGIVTTTRDGTASYSHWPGLSVGVQLLMPD
jgi:hypothetical protein